MRQNLGDKGLMQAGKKPPVQVLAAFTAGDYLRFNATYTHDELVEHFLLTLAELLG